MKKNKKVRFYIHIEEEDLKALRLEANKEGISGAGFVRRAIKKEIERVKQR